MILKDVYRFSLSKILFFRPDSPLDEISFSILVTRGETGLEDILNNGISVNEISQFCLEIEYLFPIKYSSTHLSIFNVSGIAEG